MDGWEIFEDISQWLHLWSRLHWQPVLPNVAFWTDKNLASTDQNAGVATLLLWRAPPAVVWGQRILVMNLSLLNSVDFALYLQAKCAMRISKIYLVWHPNKSVLCIKGYLVQMREVRMAWMEPYSETRLSPVKPLRLHVEHMLRPYVEARFHHSEGCWAWMKPVVSLFWAIWVHGSLQRNYLCSLQVWRCLEAAPKSNRILALACAKIMRYVKTSQPIAYLCIRQQPLSPPGSGLGE